MANSTGSSGGSRGGSRIKKAQKHQEEEPLKRNGKKQVNHFNS